jgi:hypothetical protein
MGKPGKKACGSIQCKVLDHLLFIASWWQADCCMQVCLFPAWVQVIQNTHKPKAHTV